MAKIIITNLEPCFAEFEASKNLHNELMMKKINILKHQAFWWQYKNKTHLCTSNQELWFPSTVTIYPAYSVEDLISLFMIISDLKIDDNNIELIIKSKQNNYFNICNNGCLNLATFLVSALTLLIKTGIVGIKKKGKINYININI